MKTIEDIFRIARIVISVAAAFFIVLNDRWSQLDEAIISPSFYVAVFISFVIAYVLMYFIHYVSLKIDKRWPWEKTWLARILMQLLLCVAIPLLLDILFAATFIESTGRDFLSSGYLEQDFEVIVIFIVLVNGFYPLYYFLAKYLLSADISQPMSQEIPADELLTVDYNGNHIQLHPSTDILFVYREGKLLKVQTISGSIYSVSNTLANINEHLPTEYFCQINRSVVVNLRTLKGFSAAKRNNLQVRFRTEYHPIIKDRDDERYKVTKEHVEEFKNLFQNIIK